MFLNPAPPTPRHALFAFVLVAVLVPATGTAQLSDAIWSEVVSLNADNDTDNASGFNPLAPEPQSALVTGSSYSIEGSVSFNSPGPPNSTTTLSASHVSGLAEFLGGSASCIILYEFAVAETASPPVSVSTVPVTVSATGSAEAGGDSQLVAQGEVFFSVGTPGSPMISWRAKADNSLGQASDSFDETARIEVAPGAGITVNMTNASELYPMGALPSGVSASCTAYLDPVFVVADELIPGGGGASYRDHYEIEFSPGYWALGTVPVEPTTWGKIKKLYGN